MDIFASRRVLPLLHLRPHEAVKMKSNGYEIQIAFFDLQVGLVGLKTAYDAFAE
jgi:hypothetical protein